MRQNVGLDGGDGGDGGDGDGPQKQYLPPVFKNGREVKIDGCLFIYLSVQLLTAKPQGLTS